jgi:predicted enzyme related to lactoylglutathione lyase
MAQCAGANRVEVQSGRVIDAGGEVIVPSMDVPGGSRILQAVDDQGLQLCSDAGTKLLTTPDF